MTTVHLELIRDAFKASLKTDDRECKEDYDSSDEESFHDALTDLQEIDPFSKDFVNALEYTKAYAEIARIFEHLNIAFRFVGENLQESCNLINTVVSKHDKAPVSLEQTLAYDEEENFQYNITSCILWLHRPLEFIIDLFRNIPHSCEEPVAETAKRCYLNTLGQHHAWPVQQTVGVLLLTLPTKEEIIDTMKLGSKDQTYSLLLEVADIADVVYKRVQKMVERLKLN